MFEGFFAGETPGGGTGKGAALWVLAALATGAVLLLWARPILAAETFVVNRTTNESNASLGDDFCDTNTAAAGNQCTFRAAIQQANEVDNLATDPDEIHFNIPGDRTKVKTIKPASELPAIIQPVIIDGYTQLGSRKNTRASGAINAAPKVQLDGSAAGSTADGITIQGISNVTIRGLIINRFGRSGVFLTSTDGSDDNRIEGNFVGINATGTADLGNGGNGVEFNGLNDGNVVGGDLPAQRNLVSGNDGDGVFAVTSGTDTIRGNLIGTDKAGTSGLHNGTTNDGEGISLGGQNSVVAENTIAFNTSDGVQVKSNSTGTGHDVGPNSIFSNDGLGIDLVDNANFDQGPNGNGPNTNDGGGAADDADTGPNDLQNSPAIAFATTSASTGETEIDAFLDSVPNTEFVIRFYSNPHDTGEGKFFVGDLLVLTNVNGTASINDFVANRTVPLGQSITATATKVAAPRNTSEFSGEPRSVRAAP